MKVMTSEKRSLMQPKEAGNLPLSQIRAAVEGVHLLPDEQGWVVRKLCGDRTMKHFARHDEAEKFANDLSQRDHVQLFVHDQPAAS